MMCYKGYRAKEEYSMRDGCFFGKIADISDLVLFESDSLNGLEREFRLAVDDYIAFRKRIAKGGEQ